MSYILVCRYLEGFWDLYRKGGELFGKSPTNAQYGQALENALKAGAQAAKQRSAHGILDSAKVPRIPSRLTQKKALRIKKYTHEQKQHWNSWKIQTGSLALES
jgi:hypothetical protein